MEESRQLIGLDLSMASREVIEVLIEDISETDVFEEIAKANVRRPEILMMLVENHDTPEGVKEFVSRTLSIPVTQRKELVKVDRERSERHKEIRRESLLQKIQRLTVSARIQLALKGGREIRGILARDTNKEVMLSVLENGKITTSEIELIAKSRQALEEALRRISKNREWMKNYAVVLALVSNPKTPAGIAVTRVSDLRTRDLIILERNRNVAEAVRIAAKKLLHARRPG
jgi:hypothetical protein